MQNLQHVYDFTSQSVGKDCAFSKDGAFRRTVRFRRTVCFRRTLRKRNGNAPPTVTLRKKNVRTTKTQRKFFFGAYCISEWGYFYAQGLGKAWFRTNIMLLLVIRVIFMHRVWGRLGLGLKLRSYL